MTSSTLPKDEATKPGYYYHIMYNLVHSSEIILKEVEYAYKSTNKSDGQGWSKTLVAEPCYCEAILRSVSR